MKKTQVWAHRGASGWDKQYAPENTLIAFEKAIAMGADGIEFDVQLTKDGQVVVAHDERIERVSNGTGWLKDYTLAELKKMNFSKTHPEYGFVEIPTLQEVLSIMQGKSLKINVELKTGLIYYDKLEEKTLDIVAAMGLEERVIYSSFNHYSLMKLREIMPTAEIGLLTGENFMDLSYYPNLFHASAVHPPKSFGADPAFIEACHMQNLKVYVWTVDVKTEMRALCDMGVDSFFTNCPDIGRKIADGDYSIIPDVIGPRKTLKNKIKDRFKQIIKG